jgi:NAD(P)-dependent dehydrogenase (short-subunit alcohol dehydrogenase family)
MENVAGKTAVVTGGGSGIGRALALSLAEAGANVVVADIEEDAAQRVADEVEALGVGALAVRTDVADFAAVQALADGSYERFGAVHILCNNAGVLIMARLIDGIPQDAAWVLSVNVMGVIHGVHAFVPRMTAQGEPGHILNTASVAGFGGGGVYGMSKAAVVSISETLREELADAGIGVSVLCPANISSRINDSERNRPPTMGRNAPQPFAEIVDFGLDPMLVGKRAVEAIRANELYVFTFPVGWEAMLAPRAEERFTNVLAALDKGGLQ